MQRFILVISGILIMSCLAFGQVDTMRLAEVGSVVAPGNITNWYFQDLNGDSIKEIILTTANSVNIYNGQTFSPIWSQDGFTNPKDLNFADINNDGLIDFSVKDTSHIYLIDPHHSTTIWTSPALDSLYRCYTIGDRNGDGWVDMLIARQEWFTRRNDSLNTDTAWISIWNGSNLFDFQEISLLYKNTSSWSEKIKSIKISQLTYQGSLNSFILCFSDIGAYSQYWSTSMGALYYINNSNLAKRYCSVGSLLYQENAVQADSQFAVILGSRFSSAQSGWTDIYKYLTQIGPDSSTSMEILSLHGPGGGMVFCNDIVAELSDRPGSEWAVLTSSFSLRNLHSQELLFEGDLPEAATHFIRPSFRYDNSQGSFLIFNKIYPDPKYYLFNLNTYLFQSILITSIGLNGSINLYSIPEYLLYTVISNSIYFYVLAPRTGIDDPEATPSTFFLSPNYPNPFNSSTLIEYGLPSAGIVKVDIFDILGRKIQTLVDETQAAGYHQVNWKADDVPSGMYFYRIQAGDNTQTKKCLLIK